MKTRLVGMLGTVILVGVLVSACGVPQEEVDALQQQITDMEAEKATLETDKAALETQAEALKKAQIAGNILLSSVPDAPPRAPRPAPDPDAPPPPPPPTPPAHENVELFMYVDTVTSGGGESPYSVDASTYCSISSVFKRGMRIVWRMKVVDTSTGNVLQGTDVKSAVVSLPGGTEDFSFGRHGGADDSPWFWTAYFDVPPDFPLGILDFVVEVTTNDGKTGTFKQLAVNYPAINIVSSLNIVQ